MMEADAMEPVAGREITGACSPVSWVANPAETAAMLDAFFEEDDEDVIAFARGICAGCDVRQQCLDVALSRNERFGIWGGLTPDERKVLRRARKTNYDPEQEGPDE